MLGLEDFVHLPQAAALIERLVANESGLIVVAGLEARPAPGGFLPSGRAAIHRFLLREMLARRPGAQAIVGGGQEAPRLARPLRQRVKWTAVGPKDGLSQAIAQTAARWPDLLVVDQPTRNSFSWAG